MKNLSRTAVITFFILLMSKVLGFSREILLAYKYGTSYINDAYAICVSLPAILFSLFASGIAQSYIPTYTRIESNKKKNFFSNVVTVLFVFSIVVAIACVILDKQIIDILAPGFDDKTKIITEYFIDIVAWHLPAYVIFNILSANAQVKESFVVANICDYIVVNIVLIISIALSSEQFLGVMAGGYVVAMVFATIILAIYSKKKLNLKYHLVFKPFDNDFGLLIKLAIPLGVSVMVNQLNSTTDRMFASMLGTGITSALEYANRVQGLFLTLTTTVFISVCFPRINKCFSNKDLNGGVYYIKKAVLLTALFSIPFMLIIIGFAEPIVKILFERGAFDSNSTKITAECLVFYAIGIPFYALREVESKALAANMKQKVILKNTVITVAINIILNILLLKSLRHVGLALATSIAGIVCSIMMFFDLKDIKIIGKEELFEVVKIIVSAFASGGLSRVLYSVLISYNIKDILAFVLAMLLFAIVYLVICIVFKVKVVFWCAKSLLKRNSNKI